jgi:thiol-disulfide isomerase/thioredoxin
LPSTPSSTDATPPGDSPSRPSRAAIVALVGVCLVVPLALLGVILATRSSNSDNPAVAPGCTGSKPTTPTTQPIAATPGHAGVGAPAPDFRLVTLDGCTVEQLAAHRGKPVVLTFFASWCHPCEQEMPLLQQAHKEHPEKFDVLGVTYKDLRGDAIDFTHRLGVTFPAMYDEGAVSDRYRISSIPQTWFIDANGVVRERVFGITSRAALDEPLNRLLAHRS